MIQEDKELLLKDLCERLLYRVIIQVKDWASLDTELKIGHINRLKNDDIELKPYLRPMSSMTEEEKKELERLIDEKLNKHIVQEDDGWTPWVLYDTTGIKNYVGGERFYFDEMSFIYDWLNAHHFDYRGLIEKGLAIEAPEGMYNI